MKKHNQQGIVLIVSLVFLLGLSALMLAALTISHLQTKMSAHWQQAQQAFANAESLLTQAETIIHITDVQGENSSTEKGNYHYQLIKQEQCANYYQITAQGNYANTKAKLISILKISKITIPECQSLTEPIKQRVFWQQQ
jgi:Tfp pilus assembly protein PilX